MFVFIGIRQAVERYPWQYNDLRYSMYEACSAYAIDESGCKPQQVVVEGHLFQVLYELCRGVHMLGNWLDHVSSWRMCVSFAIDFILGLGRDLAHSSLKRALVDDASTWIQRSGSELSRADKGRKAQCMVGNFCSRNEGVASGGAVKELQHRRTESFVLLGSRSECFLENFQACVIFVRLGSILCGVLDERLHARCDLVIHIRPCNQQVNRAKTVDELVVAFAKVLEDISARIVLEVLFILLHFRHRELFASVSKCIFQTCLSMQKHICL